MHMVVAVVVVTVCRLRALDARLIELLACHHLRFVGGLFVALVSDARV